MFNTKEKCEICSRSLEEHEGKELTDCNRKLWQMQKAAPAMHQKLIKIKTWLTMLSTDAQEHLKTERNFATLVEAWQHDIKNYQAVIADVDKVLAQAEGRIP